MSESFPLRALYGAVAPCSSPFGNLGGLCKLSLQSFLSRHRNRRTNTQSAVHIIQPAARQPVQPLPTALSQHEGHGRRASCVVLKSR